MEPWNRYVNYKSVDPGKKHLILRFELNAYYAFLRVISEFLIFENKIKF